MELDTVVCSDALDLLYSLDAHSADAIITDMPYGTTACEWDTPVSLVDWWKAVKHAIKPHGAIVTTASQPFTSVLIGSNLGMFRHEWIWEKTLVTGHLNAKRQPMKAHENIVIFAAGGVEYHPQFTSGTPYRATSGAAGGYVRDKATAGHTTISNGKRYPRTVIRFKSVVSPVHPTQKPVALYDYLIRTYTNEGELVVDPFAGSGTTLIAARNLGRRYIGGDSSEHWVDYARKQLAMPHTTPMF